MVHKMKVVELKMYLRLRYLTVSGKKAELVAGVFAAIENHVQVKKTAEEVESDLCNEYQAKLLLDSQVIPDPNHLISGWLSEDDGIYFWPLILYADIFNFLTFNPSELGSTDLNDCKNSKAYSYFNRGWLDPVSYHSIDELSTYCFFKSDCRPSERLNDPPHKLWICISKTDAKIK